MSVPGTQGGIIVGNGRSPRVPGIDGNHLSPVLLGLHNPSHADGMVFGSVAAHDKKAITVFEVHPVIGHGTAPKRLSQSRNSWAVSDPGLVVDVNQPQCPDHRIESRTSPHCRCWNCRGATMFSTRLTTWPLSFFSMKPASRVFFTRLAISPIAQSQLFSCHLSLFGARYSTFVRRLGFAAVV